MLKDDTEKESIKKGPKKLFEWICQTYSSSHKIKITL
jgi:hypothetical protein